MNSILPNFKNLSDKERVVRLISKGASLQFQQNIVEKEAGEVLYKRLRVYLEQTYFQNKSSFEQQNITYEQYVSGINSQMLEDLFMSMKDGVLNHIIKLNEREHV